jgi:hypothetical protein
MRQALLGFALALLLGACATAGDRPSTSSGPGAGGAALGRQCLTGSGVSCALAAPAPLDGPCSCATGYGPQGGKVVPEAARLSSSRSPGPPASPSIPRPRHA